MTLDEHLALVPGSGCDERLFAPQMDVLRQVARLHVVDNTGHPRIDRMASAALERLPERFALAGLSQGGLVACEIVRQAPERARALINQQRIFLTRPDYRPLLPRIAVPTLVLVGDQDTLAPVEAAVEAAAAIPTAELVVVPGSGHLSTLEAPAAVTTALQQWLIGVRVHATKPTPPYEPSARRTAP